VSDAPIANLQFRNALTNFDDHGSFSQMYRIDASKKRDPVLRWGLPDRVFFACGACHILAYAFLEQYRLPKAKALWLKSEPGFTGNHIIVANGDWAFDYHGYSRLDALLTHTRRKAERWWPGWDASVVPLPLDVLISEGKSRTYDGLWLRGPQQFLNDALPRARTYLGRFPAPP
jgi:hypothetical protein